MAKEEKTQRRAKGEGSIYKMQDGRFGAAISLGSADGKRIRKTVTGRSEEEVKEKMWKLIQENNLIETDEYDDYIDPDITVSDFIIDYLKYNANGNGNLQSRTILDYKYSTSHFEKKFGHMKIKDINIKHIQAFFREIVDAKDDQGEGYRYSQSTIKRIVRLLKVMFKRAESKGIITKNPCNDCDFKTPTSKAIRQKVESFEEDEIMEIIETIKSDPQLYPMIMTSLYTGMRTEELLALKWKCIDRENSKIKIEIARTFEVKFDESFNKVGTASKIGNTKTSGSYRDIVLASDDLFNIIDEWKKYAAENTKTKFGPDDFVFGNSRNAFFTYSGYRNKVIKYFKKHSSNVDGLKLHRLRHTAATLAIMQDVSVLALQSLLGHTQLSTTSDYVTRNKKIVESATEGVCMAIKEIEAMIAKKQEKKEKTKETA